MDKIIQDTYILLLQKGLKTGDNFRAAKLVKRKRLTALLTNVELFYIIKLNY